MKKNCIVIIFEPRSLYQRHFVESFWDSKVSVKLAKSLRDIQTLVNTHKKSILLIDSELEVGETMLFDYIPDLIRMGISERLVFFVPSSIKKSRLEQLLSLEPLDVISRTLPPNKAKKRIEQAFSLGSKRTNKSDLAKMLWLRGAFNDNEYSKDRRIIERKGLGGVGSIAAYMASTKEGDVTRSVRHLVDAFKTMPFSYHLLKLVLKHCRTRSGSYKAGLMFLRNHPTTTPTYLDGFDLAIKSVGADSSCAKKLNEVLNSRLANSLKN